MSHLARRIVGTAGHVDHGKSALIEALTGINPDRLAEERRRGMTIDLGFARLDLPGMLVGVVDVPGHQRFIRNMLAGAHGLDAALLVVSLEEGVMPQTREHLEILEVLGVSAGVVALTKRDLVDDGWAGAVTADVAGALAGTSLAGAPLVPVSALRGDGLESLRDRLRGVLVQAPPRAERAPLLHIDRVFTLSGFGTVVTGTLDGGELERGQELELMPQGRRVRIRGLQEHGTDVNRAQPGSRVAVNLQGVDRAEVERGHLLLAPGSARASLRADVRLRVSSAAGAAVRDGGWVRIHAGAAEAGARVSLVDARRLEPGETGYARLRFDRPLALRTGDRFVIRRASPSLTLGGGQVADPLPEARRPGRDVLAARLDGGPLARLVAEVGKHPGGTGPQAVAASLGVRPVSAAAQLERAAGDGALVSRAGVFLTPRSWGELTERARALLQERHRTDGVHGAMGRAELTGRLGVSAGLAAALVAELETRGIAGAGADAVWLREGEEGRVASRRRALASVQRTLEQNEFAPPPPEELARIAGGAEEFRALMQSGELIRLSDEVVFTRQAFERARQMIIKTLQEEGEITVARARDVLGSTRKYLLPLLNRLDEEKVTIRRGEVRVLR